MKISSNEQLANAAGEILLWEVVSEYAETHLELLQEALLTWCGLIDAAEIAQITFAEVRECDEFIVSGFSVMDGILTVKYEMPAGILARNDDGSICYHVTTWCSGTVGIPDIDSYDWNAVPFGDLPDVTKQEVLSYRHLVRKISLAYEETEADDLNA